MLGCSVDEIARWRAGDEATPDVAERHLRALFDPGGLAWGFGRLMGPRCSACGAIVGRSDNTCSGCQADLG
jgi:hypothetical protein